MKYEDFEGLEYSEVEEAAKRENNKRRLLGLEDENLYIDIDGHSYIRLGGRYALYSIKKEIEFDVPEYLKAVVVSVENDERVTVNCDKYSEVAFNEDMIFAELQVNANSDTLDLNLDVSMSRALNICLVGVGKEKYIKTNLNIKGVGEGLHIVNISRFKMCGKTNLKFSNCIATEGSLNVLREVTKEEADEFTEKLKDIFGYKKIACDNVHNIKSVKDIEEVGEVDAIRSVTVGDYEGTFEIMLWGNQWVVHLLDEVIKTLMENQWFSEFIKRNGKLLYD